MWGDAGYGWYGGGGQHGGLIMEPILGMGLRSKKPYTFGEAGPEKITPLPDMYKGPQGKNEFHFHNHGTVIDRAAFEDFSVKIHAQMKKLDAWGH